MMEGKVTLINAGGEVMGETFFRRASQLVKQQRAVWVDESQKAIQFKTDTLFDADADAAGSASSFMGDDVALYELAKERVRSRWLILLHTLALIPVTFFCVIMGYAFFRGNAAYLVIGFTWGSWFMLYACHVYGFYRNHVRHRLHDYSMYNYWNTRRAAKIATEVELIKRMSRP